MGRVAKIEVLEALPGCTGESIRAVRAWRFTPAMVNGRPVAVYFNVSLSYKLLGLKSLTR
jgi:hypothetical protein